MSDLLAKLTTPRLPTEDVPIDGVGTVTVRGLSREEMLGIEPGQGLLPTERRMLAAAMVDPPMTLEQVEAWQKASPAAELSHVIDTVNRLSGVAANSAREAYKSV